VGHDSVEYEFFAVVQAPPLAQCLVERLVCWCRLFATPFKMDGVHDLFGEPQLRSVASNDRATLLGSRASG